jgi:DNA polymerase V
MTTLEQFAPDIEVYSIDEAFLVLTGFEHLDLTEYGNKIKKTIKQWVGMPTTVGIGSTKTLAKVASTIAKKYRKFNGVFSIVDHPKHRKILQTLDVEDV